MTIFLQKKDTSQYLIHWNDKTGHLLSGVMKVFHPSSLNKYQNEVRLIAKINSKAFHPNIAKYHWYSEQNQFSVAIADLTGDIHSVESG